MGLSASAALSLKPPRPRLVGTAERRLFPLGNLIHCQQPSLPLLAPSPGLFV
jgi:hypothetical protein